MRFREFKGSCYIGNSGVSHWFTTYYLQLTSVLILGFVTWLVDKATLDGTVIPTALLSNFLREFSTIGEEGGNTVTSAKQETIRTSGLIKTSLVAVLLLEQIRISEIEFFNTTGVDCPEQTPC